MAFRFAPVLNADTDLAANQDDSLEQSADSSTLIMPQLEKSDVPNVADAPESPEVQGPSKESKPTSSKSTKTAAGTRNGKRSASGRNADASKRCQIGFWLTLSDRRALRTVCANNDTNITSFTSGAVLDAMRYTYECTSAGCRCQFTLRTNDDIAPAKAAHCPVCGEKVSAVRY